MGYDKVWILEEDTIAPVDTLKKLLEVDAPVVSGCYILRHGCMVSNIFLKIEKSVERWEDLQRFKNQTIEVEGGAMGCLLVDKAVLKDFNFLLRDNYAPDTTFMRHCVKNRIRQMARLDVQCGHIRADGKILWPDDKTGWRLADA
jgi:hypothetical protein